jgi:hypothetical protein
MKIALDGREGTFPANATAAQVIKALWPERVDQVLALLWGGLVLELNQALSDGMNLNMLTFAHEEGRRIYERSLRFVFLLAASRLFPGEQVRIAVEGSGKNSLTVAYVNDSQIVVTVLVGTGGKRLHPVVHGDRCA